MGLNQAKKDVEYFAERWQNGLSGVEKTSFPHTKEEWDKRADKWVRSFERAQGLEQYNARVTAVASYLRGQGLLTVQERVIDVGCGPGYYVAEFAKSAGQVTGTDFSPKMLEYAARHAQESGAENVAFLECDFNNADVKALGWEKAFDLVFTSITPAFRGLDALEKINSMSRAWCFNSGWAYRDNNIKSFLRTALLPQAGDEEKRGEGPYYLFNLLWLQGCRPKLEYYREVSEEKVFLDEEAALQYANMLLPPERVDEKTVKRARELLETIAEDGWLKERAEALFCWMLWPA
ncbi:MAG: class I SAM-dependent methyltransferase [Clostridiales bacterium]|nr:class I SAM-dependent methyltransferase [Clostridiales bacterium]